MHTSKATAEKIENATNNLIPHLLDRKGFYGNVIVSVNRGNKIRKCYLKEKINVKPHFRNGSSLDLWFWIMLFWSALKSVVQSDHHQRTFLPPNPVYKNSSKYFLIWKIHCIGKMLVSAFCHPLKLYISIKLFISVAFFSINSGFQSKELKMNK